MTAIALKNIRGVGVEVCGQFINPRHSITVEEVEFVEWLERSSANKERSENCLEVVPEVAANGDDQKAPASGDAGSAASREKLIDAAMDKLGEGDLTQAGIPHVVALERITGFQLSASQRDDAVKRKKEREAAANGGPNSD